MEIDISKFTRNPRIEFIHDWRDKPGEPTIVIPPEEGAKLANLLKPTRHPQYPRNREEQPYGEDTLYYCPKCGRAENACICGAGIHD